MDILTPSIGLNKNIVMCIVGGFNPFEKYAQKSNWIMKPQGIGVKKSKDI